MSSFISSREFLFIVTTSGIDEESPLPRAFATANDILDCYDDEDATCFFVVSLDGRVRDVTEVVARAYFEVNETHPSERHVVPPYVRNSDAWDAFEADWYRQVAWFADARNQGVI